MRRPPPFHVLFGHAHFTKFKPRRSTQGALGRKTGHRKSNQCIAQQLPLIADFEIVAGAAGALVSERSGGEEDRCGSGVDSERATAVKAIDGGEGSGGEK